MQPSDDGRFLYRGGICALHNCAAICFSCLSCAMTYGFLEGSSGRPSSDPRLSSCCNKQRILLATLHSGRASLHGLVGLRLSKADGANCPRAPKTETC